MFQIGRYDPRANARKQQQGVNTNESIKSNRKLTGKRTRNGNAREGRGNGSLDREGAPKVSKSATEAVSSTTGGSSNRRKQVREEAPIAVANDLSRDADSASSSSAPSSDDESEEEVNQKDDRKSIGQSTLRVIAPISKPVSSERGHSTRGTNEAFDDFDIENEQMVNTAGVTSVIANSGIMQDGGAELSDEIRTALHMSSLPIQEASAVWNLAPFLIDNLERDGYTNFFPIQSLVIPDVIASERHAHIRARDICVAAPTGSGKTLSFVLPVLNALSTRTIRRLRALVVLPSRDLASQVFDVFQRYTHGSDLRVGLAIGQSDFEAEQRALTVGSPDRCIIEDLEVTRHRLLFSPGDLQMALQTFPDMTETEKPRLDGNLVIPAGGRSAVDVLVATPGRLVDHLDKTPGFTLQHLRFLVIDEADRLVNQSYHNWVGRVAASANQASINAWHEIEIAAKTGDASTVAPLKVNRDGTAFVVDPITWRRGGTGGDDSIFSNNNGSSLAVAASVCRPVQLRKLLFSATLTKDPQKLAALGLVNPKHFDAHHLTGEKRGGSNRYSMPPSLAEYIVECTAEQKPLVLLALLLEQLQRKPSQGSTKNIIVVFTSSLDSTHRLVRLLQLLWGSAGVGDPSSVAEFSSALNQSQRSRLMKRCTDPEGEVSVVVCSDGMSRGMDIPCISAVINYDVPPFAKTYVHRCGRTARAGREGSAISVLKGGQVGQFGKMRGLIDEPNRVKVMGVKKDLVRNAVAQYRSCVSALREVMQAEKEGDLGATETIPLDFFPTAN